MIWQVEKMAQREREHEEMLSYMRDLHQENMKLKVQLQEAEERERYATPDGSLAASKGGDGRWPKSGGHETRDDRPGDDLRREMTGPGEEFRKSLRVFGMPGDATGSPPRARPRSRSPTRGSPQQSTSSQDPTVQTMLKLMQGMQQMQQALMNQQAGRRSGADDHREDEYVRGSVELHKLAEWAPESAPVDFQDGTSTTDG